MLAEIEHFFAVYTDLEDKKVETHGFRGLEAALLINGEARQRAGGRPIREDGGRDTGENIGRALQALHTMVGDDMVGRSERTRSEERTAVSDPLHHGRSDRGSARREGVETPNVPIRSQTGLNGVRQRFRRSPSERRAPHRSVPSESKPERSRRSGRGFLQKTAAKVYDAVAESALIQELEIGARIDRQRRIAPDDGPDEQVALVHQPGLEGLCREVRASHEEIAAGRGLQVVHRSGVEAAFELGVGG